MKQNRFRKISLAALMLTLLMAAAPGAYAYQGSYHDFRGSDISLYLPEDWTAEEIDAQDSEDQDYEEILQAWDETGDSGLKLSLYYMMDKAPSNTYIYLDGYEEDALEYYENYGQTTIDALYDATLAWPLENATQSEWQLSDGVFYDGEWNGFLVIDGSGSTQQAGAETTFAHTIYLTAHTTEDSQTIVHNILVFYNDGLTALNEEQAELARQIAEEFYDYGYYNVIAGVSDDESGGGISWEGDQVSGDGTGALIIALVCTVIPFLIFVAGIVIAIRKIRQRKKNGRRDEAGPVFRKLSTGIQAVQEELDFSEKKAEWKKPRFNREARDTIEKMTTRTERRNTIQMRSREATNAEIRYEESLKTLLKSGLLTKHEMEEMLERHRINKERQRRRR